MTSIDTLFKSSCRYEYGSFNPDKTMYFITITIRKSKGLYSTPLEFADALTEYCDKYRYPKCIIGIIEYSAKFNGYHFHGLTNWKYKHFSKVLPIYALVKPINASSINKVIDYIMKGQSPHQQEPYEHQTNTQIKLE